MTHYIYFMTNNHNTTLYIGMTNNLMRRVREHKNAVNKNCFTYQYNCHKIVYCEESSNINDAITREKQLKNWKRDWKNALVEKDNPNWRDLWDDWFPAGDSGSSPE